MHFRSPPRGICTAACVTSLLYRRSRWLTIDGSRASCMTKDNPTFRLADGGTVQHLSLFGSQALSLIWIVRKFFALHRIRRHAHRCAGYQCGWLRRFITLASAITIPKSLVYGVDRYLICLLPRFRTWRSISPRSCCAEASQSLRL